MRKIPSKFKDIMLPLRSKKVTKYKFVGFDIETYGRENKFYMGSIYYYRRQTDKIPTIKIFYDKKDFAEYILTRKFSGCYFVATNLEFDFCGLVNRTKYWNDFKIIMSGGSMLLAEYKGKMHKQNHGSIKFIDTLNYAKMSVQQLGKIVGIPKLSKPEFLGKKPRNELQRLELERYNIQDSRISFEFMQFLQQNINSIGGKLRITIASTSLDIWRRKFQPIDLMKEERALNYKFNPSPMIFNAYYGGRTEAFKKGMFKNVYYYDVNSLYPSVMINEYPLPQSIKINSRPDIDTIKGYHGVSECIIKSPLNMDKPLLPFRTKDKLIFPLGQFRATYNHIELRKALELGYIIVPLKQIYYTQTFKPFKSFVEYFYTKRIEYKKQGSSVEVIYKLILNSLYGKFAERHRQEYKMIDLRDDSMSFFDLKKEVAKYDTYEEKNGLMIVRRKSEFRGTHSFPILSCCVSSYARVKMYDYLTPESVIYTDTDSVMTTEKCFPEDLELGGFKVERFFKEAFIVKPKFYVGGDNIKDILESESTGFIKLKGLNRATGQDINKILNKQSVTKTKFVKLRESFTRNLKVNSIIQVAKSFQLEDNKRNWELVEDSNDYINKKFESKPLVVNEEVSL